MELFNEFILYLIKFIVLGFIAYFGILFGIHSIKKKKGKIDNKENENINE